MRDLKRKESLITDFRASFSFARIVKKLSRINFFVLIADGEQMGSLKQWTKATNLLLKNFQPRFKRFLNRWSVNKRSYNA